MSIPLDWDDFKEWRDNSLNYHAFNSLEAYSMAFNYFELAREYYQVHGFPKREKYKSGANKGKYRPLKNAQEHEQDRQQWIKRTAEKKGFKVPSET